MKYETLVVLDLETTGLVFDEPKITELAMIAVSIAALDSTPTDEPLPRILNKFVKFFNPKKTIHSKAAELSDLNNLMLEQCPSFTVETVNSIESFLNDLRKPICFVAHNGNVFDFPILYNEIHSVLSPRFDPLDEYCTNTMQDSSTQTETEYKFLRIDCVDSLPFFRSIYRLLNEVEAVESDRAPLHRGYVEIAVQPSSIDLFPSLRLTEIYRREMNSNFPRKSHRAEDDCLMLLTVLKIYLPDWLQWIDEHQRPLNEFSPLPVKSTGKILPFTVKTEKKMKRPLRF